MSEQPLIQTTDLSRTFQALRNRNPENLSRQQVPPHPDYRRVPSSNYSPITSVNTGSWGNGMARFASSSGIVYGQPQFFSPVHTPINWQIPSKRLEEMQWARFFYMNEPKIAAAIDFYCFEPDTPILMADGKQKCISSIDVGERVRSHDGTVNIVEKINCRNAENEEVLKIKISGVGGSYSPKMKVTPGHMVLTERDGKVDFVPASTIKIGDYLLTPCGYADKNKNVISDDLAWLIGVYAAEGNTIPYNHESKTGVDRRDYKGVQFTINIDEEDFEQEIKNKIRLVYGDINVTTKIEEEHRRRTIFVYRQNIGDDLCGASPGAAISRSKRLAPWVMQLCTSNLTNLLSGFLSGDGCYNPTNGFQGVGNSKILLEQIANICDMLGLENSYTVTNASQVDGKIIHNVVHNVRISRRSCGVFTNYTHKIYSEKAPDTSYARNIPYFVKGNYIYRKITEIESYFYSGKLYDLSITNCHSYVANRVAVHNSEFPMSNWTHECRNRTVTLYFDRLKEKLKLQKWCRLISHEVHLLGDCFPFIELDCPICNCSGRIGSDICEHDGGTIRRIIILNPDYVEVLSSPLNPDPIIALRPDEELINMVQRKTPGYEKLSSEVRKLVSAGQPIKLDNTSVSHLMYGENGYTKYGIGMVRRLYPILSYKTKLMVAQWIVAERLIVPIKIVKVGSDERPAGPADIAAVQAQLAQTANDPNLTIVTHHAFEMDFIGAAGKVLTLSNEFELINQEILDGMMINNALLNGEGPNFSAAAVGIEAMIQRLKTFREQITDWLREAIYIPEARRQAAAGNEAFITKNEDTGEEEVVVPKIKWDNMHLRDQQQFRTFVMQLYEKGLLSAQTVLETFDFDPDQEIERKRYDALQMVALGQGLQGGMGGGAGGGAGGGMGGGMGGLPPPGGGGEPPIGAPSDMGGPGTPSDGPSAPAGGGPAIAKASSITATQVDPSQFGGRVLKKRTRERILSDQQKQQRIYENQQRQQQRVMDAASGGEGKTQRDEMGRIINTKAERDLIPHLRKAAQDGLFGNYAIVKQFRVQAQDEEYPLDFAIPSLKVGIEADGEIFHSAPKQKAHDKERDMKLSQQGWTIIRFSDEEIEKHPQQVVQSIIKTVMQKQMYIKNMAAGKQQEPQAPQ